MDSTIINSDCTSMAEISFLDVLVYRKGDKLHTDVFVKSTDSHNILSFHSHHPRHTLRNIPYTLSRRLNTIISEPERLKSQLTTLRGQLLNSHYPVKLVDDAVNRIYELPTAGSQKKSTLYPLIFPYNNNSCDLVQKMRTNVEMLQHCSTTKHVIPDRVCISYKSSPKLMNMLMHNPFRIKKCDQPRCKLCPNIIEGHTVQLPGREIIYPNKNMNCFTANTIYALMCNNCEKLYVGQSSLPLRQRITLHRQHIRHPEYAILDCSSHFLGCGAEFRVVPLHAISNHATTSQLLFIETYFIKLLRPELNKSH